LTVVQRVSRETKKNRKMTTRRTDKAPKTLKESMIRGKEIREE
jgi:hypothetical protein